MNLKPILILIVSFSSSILLSAQNFYKPNVYEDITEDPKFVRLGEEREILYQEFEEFLNSSFDKKDSITVFTLNKLRQLSWDFDWYHLQNAFSKNLINLQLTSKQVEYIKTQMLKLNALGFKIENLERKYLIRTNVIDSTRFYLVKNQILKVKHLLNLHNNIKILEIGAGYSNSIYGLGEYLTNSEFYLNEVKQSSLDWNYNIMNLNPIIHNQIIRNKNKYYVIEGDSTSTGVEEILFDKIIMEHVFHHFDYPVEMLHSIKKSMNHSTEVFVIETFKSIWNHICDRALRKKKIVSYFEDNGFKLITKGKPKSFLHPDKRLLVFKLKTNSN